MENFKVIKEFKSYKTFYLISGILIIPISLRFITKISSIEYINVQSLLSVLLGFFLVDFVVKSSQGLFSFSSKKFSDSFSFVIFILVSFSFSLFFSILGVKINFYYFILSLLVISNILFFINEEKLNRKLLKLVNIFVIYFMNNFINFFIYKRQEIAGDVDRWQYPNTSKIFNNNLIDVFANPIDDLGYWYINLLVLANFYFAFISKIVLLSSEFIPLQIIRVLY